MSFCSRWLERPVGAVVDVSALTSAEKSFKWFYFLAHR